MKDILILSLLIIIGFVVSPAFRPNDLFCYDDHPSRFFELWHVIEKVIEEGNPLTWTNYGAAGCPSLQFYPPGYTFLGAFIYLISFKKLSIIQIYYILLLIAYFLPAFTTYLLYRKGLGYNRTASLFASLILLLFCGKRGMGCDVTGGIEVGMIAGRLAMSLFPLGVYFGIKSLDEKDEKIKTFYIPLTGVTLGFIFLSHPWYIFPSLLGVILLYLNNFPLKKKDLFQLALILAIFFGTIAFWLLPSIFYRKYFLRASFYDFSIVDILIWVKELPLFIMLYLLSFPEIFKKKNSHRRNLLSLCLIPPIILILSLLNYYILYKLFDITLMEPGRFRENIYYPMLLLSGIGSYQLISWLKDSWKKKDNLQKLVLYSVAGLLFLLPILPFTHFPHKSVFYKKELYYSGFKEKYSVEELWIAIKENTKGRVLHSSISFYPTGDINVTAPQYFYYLTPCFTGRETIGGSHWHFPIMTYYFYGEKRDKIRDWEGAFGNISLFGMSYKNMDEKFLYDMCCSLNIDTIVVSKKNINECSFFDKSKYFPLIKDLKYFKLYTVDGYKPSYLEFNKDEIKAKITKYEGGEIRILVDRANRNTYLTLKVSYYPLWKAYINKKPFRIMENSKGLVKGLMRIYAPKGENYEIVLLYEKEWVGKIGMYISIFTLFFVTLSLLVFLKKPIRSIK